MLVVADSSPFVVLINIGHVNILPRLYTEVIIPMEVSAELSDARRPQAVRDFIASPPVWLVQRTPSGCKCTARASATVVGGRRADAADRCRGG